MLSRCHIGAYRNSVYNSYRIISSINEPSQISQKIHQRNYHIATENKYVAPKWILANTLKNRSVLCMTAARSISDGPTTIPIELIADTAPILSIENAPQIADIVAATAAEPAFSTIGLCNYTPVGLVESALEFLHIGCDLPWWLAIVAATTCARICLFPVFVYVQKNAARLKNNMPKLQMIQEKLKEAKENGDQMAMIGHTTALQIFFKEKNCNPLKSLIAPVAQAPIMISFFFALNNMVNAPVESLHTGGILWFPDLIVADPYFLLPAIMSSTLAIIMEISMNEKTQLNDPNAKMMKYVMRVIPIVTFPFTMSFASAVLCYWTCNNFISLIQVALLRVDAVRDLFGVDRLIDHEGPKRVETAPIKKNEVYGVFKDSFSNIKSSQELERKRQREYNQFLAAQKAAETRKASAKQ